MRFRPPRHRIRVAAAALSLVSTLTGITAAEAAPSRKPGQWIITLQAQELPLQHTIEGCIGRGSLNDLPALAADNLTDCSQKDLHMTGHSLSIHAVCTIRGGGLAAGATISADGRVDFSGDSAFQGETRVHSDQPILGMTELHVQQSGRWEGPCPEGARPGDVVIDGTPRHLDSPAFGR